MYGSGQWWSTPLWWWGGVKRALRDSREVHVRLPADLYQALAEKASAEGVPLSVLIRRLLRRGLGL